MSILSQPNTNDKDPAEIAAKRLINMTKQIYNQMVQTYNQGTQIFWKNNNASASEVSTKLGNNAKEIFELHYKLGQLLSTIKPEDIASANALIGNFTMNDDGTVTVVESST